MQKINQKPKAQVASIFVGVIARDAKNRPTKLVVPGSEGKQYKVSLRREDGGIIKTTCYEKNGGPCLGNSFQLCYHSMAAIGYCLTEAKQLSAWCENEDKAESVNHIHRGHIIKVMSKQSSRIWYLVVSPKLEQLPLEILDDDRTVQP